MSEWPVRVCLPAGRMLVSWPIAALRRYGVNNVSLTIVTGRLVNEDRVCQEFRGYLVGLWLCMCL